MPIRIGISSGPLVAGVVGRRKFFYDVWGDVVNVASRMESTGVAGRIQVSMETFELLKEDFVFEPRGPGEVRGKGVIFTWLLLGRRGEKVPPGRAMAASVFTTARDYRYPRRALSYFAG